VAEIRPMTAGDIEPAADVMTAALPIPPEYDDGNRRAWMNARTEHLLGTDPGGCWVAEDDGEVVGAAIALVRDGIWGLSMMAVHPDRHARGAGTGLMRAALAHAEGARGGLICASEDPRATRLYARAGFELHPCVSTAGIVDRAGLPAGLRARPSEDFEAASAVSRTVRGGAYGAEDLAMVAGRPGLGMLAIESRGFAIVHPSGSPNVLCAADEEAATDLLLSSFAHGPSGSSVHVDFLSAGQDWAIRASLACRLAISAEGPLFTRGELGPLRPWKPSGALL
jgi:ribosomal protein S18 acetylase RimI-like enzyme